MGRLARIAATLKQKYREEKAGLQGVGLSKARMVKNAVDIPEIRGYLTKGGPAKPIEGANVRMMNKQPMTFFTDGSLRNSYGARPELSGRQLVKLRKRLRRARKERLVPKEKAFKITRVVEPDCDCHVGEANIANHRADCPHAK